ncbi:Titin like protein [Argiope bruennichi]|uniref:Titin like protein n=1 Tax=Argiope bruennichi TaxID=94029 RepID=A0A8T0E7B5_ARGBR|nr:Titin like protein [Argiope bruennichi]
MFHFVMLNSVIADSGKPKIRPFQFSSDLELGMREVVNCVVTYGDPPFEFSWFKDGQLLTDLLEGITYRKSDEFMSNLIISKLGADSNGNYTCRVTNAAGFDEKSAILSDMNLLASIAFLSLHLSFSSGDAGEPRIKSFHFTRDLKLGMRESVTCAVVDGDPPFEFSWFKDGRPVTDGQGISIRKSDEYDSKLVISKVTGDSNGNYTCKASNMHGFDEKSAFLLHNTLSEREKIVRELMAMYFQQKTGIVIILCLYLIFVSAGPGEPKIKSFHFSSELELGMRETVQCNVLYGDAPFEFSWFKDGQLLKDSQSISIQKTDDYVSKLVIMKVDANSNGNYTCRVSNSKGYDQKSAFLSVKGGLLFSL